MSAADKEHALAVLRRRSPCPTCRTRTPMVREHKPHAPAQPTPTTT